MSKAKSNKRTTPEASGVDKPTGIALSKGCVSKIVHGIVTAERAQTSTGSIASDVCTWAASEAKGKTIADATVDAICADVRAQLTHGKGALKTKTVDNKVTQWRKFLAVYDKLPAAAEKLKHDTGTAEMRYVEMLATQLKSGETVAAAVAHVKRNVEGRKAGRGAHSKEANATVALARIEAAKLVRRLLRLTKLGADFGKSIRKACIDAGVALPKVTA